ncbi:HotDog domain-containing protein [Biscogniauxia sp. FL1348]|nr:HotDog domain-containing protein [Biscogniauxia sp. FL1348]KAI0598652.1 HotDog domain-containing protein [Biscogniauxia sp. FL1348]
MWSNVDGLLEGIQDLQGVKRIEVYLNRLKEAYKDSDERHWFSTTAPHLSVVSHSTDPSEHPRVTFRFTPQPQHSNAINSVHGGCTATLFDGKWETQSLWYHATAANSSHFCSTECTTMALLLISRPGFWRYFGVSRTLNVTYLRPVPIGEPVDVECEIVQVGKRLAVVRAVARAAAGPGEKKGPVLAICEHGKVNSDPSVSGKI